MTVGFVCTNFNAASHTRAAVASLLTGSRPNDVRIVVVDNKSADADVASLRDLATECPTVDLLLSPENVGYFPGLNLGIRRLRTTHPDVAHLVIGNNDLVFPDDFVETIQRHHEVFDRWAVVAPDLVTPDGLHQNPHVLHPLGVVRKVVWDLYYSFYGAAIAIRAAARLTGPLTTREENDPRARLYAMAGPIEQGYGACYVIGPAFFTHFGRLFAPTFMMQEEFFLYEQLKSIGQLTYYDPRFVVRHRGHATTHSMPSRRLWAISRDAHRTYKRYLALPEVERQALIAAGSHEPI